MRATSETIDAAVQEYFEDAAGTGGPTAPSYMHTILSPHEHGQFLFLTGFRAFAMDHVEFRIWPGWLDEVDGEAKLLFPSSAQRGLWTEQLSDATLTQVGRVTSTGKWYLDFPTTLEGTSEHEMREIFQVVLLAVRRATELVQPVS